jgi:hypothetical protein
VKPISRQPCPSAATGIVCKKQVQNYKRDRKWHIYSLLPMVARGTAVKYMHETCTTLHRSCQCRMCCYSHGSGVNEVPIPVQIPNVCTWEPVKRIAEAAHARIDAACIVVYHSLRLACPGPSFCPTVRCIHAVHGLVAPVNRQHVAHRCIYGAHVWHPYTYALGTRSLCIEGKLYSGKSELYTHFLFGR